MYTATKRHLDRRAFLRGTGTVLALPFLEAMVQQRQIDDFRVVLDVSNNPANRIALGYMQADVQVRYLSVVEFFIINLEGGQSVTISRQGAQQLAA